MVWTKFLLIVALVAGGAFATSPAARAASCTDFDIQTGACAEISGGDGVDVYVEDTYVSDPAPDSYSDGGGDSGGSGDGYSDGDNSNGGGDDSGGDGGGGTVFTPNAEALASPLGQSVFTPASCRGCDTTSGGPTGTPPRPPTSLTISDVLSLAPASVTLTAEPSTWSIVGSHTNFHTTATQHTQSGTVLGHPITVTFTPTTYRWDYGDGATTQTTTPGATWAALGQDDFTATPTSHVYTEKTTVEAAVTVTYTAAVTLANGTTIPVTGTLNRASTTVQLELYNADTVITIGDCNEHPQQPRC